MTPVTIFGLDSRKVTPRDSRCRALKMHTLSWTKTISDLLKKWYCGYLDDIKTWAEENRLHLREKGPCSSQKRKHWSTRAATAIFMRTVSFFCILRMYCTSYFKRVEKWLKFEMHFPKSDSRDAQGWLPSVLQRTEKPGPEVPFHKCILFNEEHHDPRPEFLECDICKYEFVLAGCILKKVNETKCLGVTPTQGFADSRMLERINNAEIVLGVLRRLGVFANGVHPARSIRLYKSTVKPHLLHIVGRPISYATSEVIQKARSIIPRKCETCTTCAMCR